MLALRNRPRTRVKPLIKGIPYLLVVLLIPFIAGCSEDWSCQVRGNTMFSVSESGKLGAAEKGCSCEQMRSFERGVFGRVDEDALRRDHGC